ncbi:hypothetical protein BGW36DRAFT_187278 [Talaromyces proteolyticus]|uniref:Uncharacterized protein n=1 Tax=Talaromyces proteolyticus TaxID=1131652 RepID=A0AAD4KR70_9EURO|nr:uncharacterized protein BGW36DRAFT_187278 [Talaromyces proteolyticus]KAH8696437.1 hypothetical protein BGW36DRAFT_187278 [Talaromyces proteolyticus]
MASTYFYNHHHQQQQQQTHAANAHLQSNNHHGGRRRGPRMASQNTQRQFRGVKSMRELAEAPTVTAFRLRFEAGRSFDLDDDLEFCPNLLTEDDLHSIHSSVSDRSSLSSGSPDSSPLQHQIQPAQQVTPSVSLSPGPSTTSYVNNVAAAAINNNINAMHFQQPAASRTRKVIPIVNPQTGVTLSSPPTSINPGMVQSQRRW